MATTVNFRELGSTGLRKSGGVILEEYLPELRGYRWVLTVPKMERDAIINGVLLMICLSLRQVAVEIKPFDDTPQADELKQFVEECIGDMSSTWADTLSEILTMLPWGWAYEEVVYKRRMGDSTDTSKRSKYTDGKIGWRKWSIRSQDSLLRWEFDEEGGLAGMWQSLVGSGTGSPPVLIPIEKALLFRTSADKANPEGKSLLRSAYRPWYMKTNMENIEGIGVERNLNGVPVIYADAQIMGANASDDEKAFYESLKTIITNLRADEQAGLILPSMYDDKGNRLYELVLLSSTGSLTQDTGAIIQRYAVQIALAMLADFIMLGHEAVGSYALSATKASTFKTALEAWLQAIADVINTHAIPKLLRLNGMDIELAPKLCFGKVGEIELADVTAFLQVVTASSMTLFPDMELENHLRSILGWPLLTEEQFAEREAKAQAEKDAQTQIQRDAINAKSQGGQQQGAKYSNDEIAAFGEAAARVVARG